MHVKEPRTLIVKEKGLAPVFLDSRLEHPAGWICARYKSYHYHHHHHHNKLNLINTLLIKGKCRGRAVLCIGLKLWCFHNVGSNPGLANHDVCVLEQDT